MAVKKPLVVGTNGKPQQLQSGDSITVATTSSDVVTRTNSEAGAIVIGTPVYDFSAGTVKKAQANAVGTATVTGLVYDTSITNATSGQIVTDGLLVATTTQWDAVAGTTGGLVFNTTYFLSPTTAGLLTATVPTTVGQLVVEIGVAWSTTDLNVNIKSEILL